MAGDMNDRVPVMLACGVILAALFAEAHPDFIAHPPRSALEMCGSLMDSGLCDAAGAIVDLRRGGLPPPAAAQSDRSAVPDHTVLPIIEDGPILLRASVQQSGEPYAVPAIPVD